MKRTISSLCLVWMLLTSSCSTVQTQSAKSPIPLKPFSTDGCSLFPDGNCQEKNLWRDCCIDHDKAYWQGGTRADRRQADAELERCVCEKSGNPALAKVMHDAVQLFGTPASPMWYRWAYGWTDGRKYQALTPRERHQVQQYLDEYVP